MAMPPRPTSRRISYRPTVFITSGIVLLARGTASRVVSPQALGPVNVKLFVLDPHTIYRRGLAACLEMLPGVDEVADAESVREAWEHPDIFAAELVVLEQ